MRALILRPEPQAGRMAAALAAAGIAADVAPMLEIVPVGDVAAAVAAAADDPQALIFTSTRAVETLASLPPAPALIGLPVFCVGAGTAAAARDAGFRNVVSADSDVAALAASLLAIRIDRFLWIAGADRAGDLAGPLGAAGRQLRIAEVYRAEPAAELDTGLATALRDGAFDCLVVASARTASAFAALMQSNGRLDALGKLVLVAISDAAAAPLSALCAETIIAARPAGDDLLAAVIALRHRLSQTGDRS